MIKGFIPYADGSPIGGVVSGGTAGSVLFVGAGSTLAQDNANFFYDDTNNALILGGTPTSQNYDTTGTQSAPVLQMNGIGVPTSMLGVSRFANTAGAACRMAMAKSRGATVGSFTAVQAGDALGLFTFQGSDGTIFKEAATIEGLCSATVSSGIVPGELRFSTYNTSGVKTQAMTINASQAVVIGTGTAVGTAKLTAALTSVRYITLGESGNGFLSRYDDNTSANCLVLENRDITATTDHGVEILCNVADNATTTTIGLGSQQFNKAQLWTTTLGTNTSYYRLLLKDGGAAPGEKFRITSGALFGFGTNAPTHTVTLPLTSNGYAHYNTADQTTNFERFRAAFVANQLYLITESGGSGTVRNMTIGVGARLLNIENSSNNFFTFVTSTGTTDIALINATCTHTAASGVAIGIAIRPILQQSGTAGYSGLLINPTETSTGSGPKRLISGQVGGVDKFVVDNAGLITAASATLIASSVALTNGAAAQVATMTNGPTAGNPTKWIPINDNGTTRYIPAW